jgi:hypothetical protein
MNDMFGGLVEGSPEEKVATRRVADEIRKLERRRAAAVAVATQEYEDALASDDGPTPRQCMEFAVQVKRADTTYQDDMMSMACEIFEQTTGTSIGALTAQVAAKVRDLGLTGFAMNEDGEIVAMGEDGPMDCEPEELLDIAEPLLSLPGMVPAEVRESLKARCEELRRERGNAPADTPMDFLAGIDLDQEFQGKRDFDGGTE